MSDARTRYIHYFNVQFSVDSDLPEPGEVPAEVIIEALSVRLATLRKDQDKLPGVSFEDTVDRFPPPVQAQRMKIVLAKSMDKDSELPVREDFKGYCETEDGSHRFPVVAWCSPNDYGTPNVIAHVVENPNRPRKNNLGDKTASDSDQDRD